ncbi:putative protein N(5)-glutamine methyltransferase [Amycolatopsis sp. NPDC059021]|uniref:putative protein N(5)-glutamine methyltransferase n=1 Tax=Amycolatopsis sp. NPDC059021 TaxID=3346704 RepID=UPI003671E314
MTTSPADSSAVIARLRAVGCVFAEDEARLLITAARTPAELDTMVRRRIDGLPLEHILGWAEFAGQRIAVDPGVFVPRRRTEFLARQAIRHAHPGAVLVDLCCGSGAVGTAVATALGDIELYAADLDPAAVECARRNVTPFGGQVFQGDLYTPLPAALHGRVDVLTANAPYVPTDAIDLMPPEARLHEPQTALDGGTDGLDILRRVIAGASTWLTSEGTVLVESSERQAPELAKAMTHNGFRPHIASSDDLGATVVIGTRGAATTFTEAPDSAQPDG